MAVVADERTPALGLSVAFASLTKGVSQAARRMFAPLAELIFSIQLFLTSSLLGLSSCFNSL